MLTRIRLRGYKSLVDVDVRLQPLTVLLGPNAAGKSNFLDALQLLSRLATKRSVSEAFEPPYRGTPLESFTFGPEGIRGLLTQEGASFSLEADVTLSQEIIGKTNRQAHQEMQEENEDGNHVLKTIKGGYVQEKCLRYFVSLEVQPQRGLVRVGHERIQVLTRTGRTKSEASAQLTSFEKRNSSNLRAMRKSDLATGSSALSLPLSAFRFPHLHALQQELAHWSFFYFEPRERMREPSVVRETRHVGMMGENLASYLNTLRAIDPADFRALELSLQTLVPTLSGIDVGVNDRGEVELRLLEGKTPIPASVLSEGTLRLLGLLALGGAEERPTLIGFEEPENGVHPRRIRLIAELLRSFADTAETQMIVTTHSPILLDALPRESLYVCRKVAGQTNIRRLTELDPIGRDAGIEAALNGDYDELTVSERMLRGDFDA